MNKPGNRAVFMIAFCAALLPALAGAGETAAVRLRTAIVVVDEVVTLGDLFEGAGSAGSVVVTPAPPPGHREVLSLRRIATAARESGLDWNGRASSGRITVERAGQRIPLRDIRREIETALMRQGMSGPRQIRLSNSRLALYVPLGSDAGIVVEHVDFDDSGSRFEAFISIPAGDDSARKIRVTGQAISVIEVPVLISAIAAGQIIAGDDLSSIKVPANRAGANIVTESSRLIGKMARRNLRPNVPLRANDIRRPVTIAKGSIVAMVVTAPGMTLTTAGRALEDGATGDTIRVLNTRTHATVEARVISPDKVQVPMTARIISAMR